jgi:hypothetical protein
MADLAGAAQSDGMDGVASVAHNYAKEIQLPFLQQGSTITTDGTTYLRQVL